MATAFWPGQAWNAETAPPAPPEALHEQSDRVAIRIGAKMRAHAAGADESFERGDDPGAECTIDSALEQAVCRLSIWRIVRLLGEEVSASRRQGADT